MRASRITMLSTGCVSALLAAVAPAQAGGVGMTAAQVRDEERLRRAEITTLGAQHAADHAAARAAARRTARSRPARRGPRSRLKAVVAGSPATVGSWDAPRPGAFPGTGINVALLRTGKVLYWGGRRDVFTREDQAHVWDPAAPLEAGVNPRKVVPPTRADETIFCSGLSLMADGRVLVTGGQLPPLARDTKGANLVMTFDPVTETWTRHADMRNGRYYPSQLLLPDGRSVSVNGTDQYGNAGDFNPDIELFDPATLGQQPLVVARHKPSGQEDAASPPLGGFYPHLFQMPSGKAFLAGPNRKDSWFFEVGPAPGNAFRWWQVAPLGAATREYSTGVLLPNPPGTPGVSSKVLLMGGTNGFDGQTTPMRSTQVFDESRVNFAGAWNANTGVGWQASADLGIERGHHNTVLLPDGTLVTVGGGWGSRGGGLYEADPGHRNVELYDPQRPTLGWRPGAAQSERRAYHSTAALLPDATVLSAGDDGGDAGGGNERDTFEIYRPPYLFAADGSPAARPAITAAPTAVGYGSSFAVGTSAAVGRAVLVAPSAVTHAVDVSQRHVELAVAPHADGNGIDVVAPPNANVAPPGWYMLFVLDRAGVPSVARFVRLSDAPTSYGPDVPPTPGTTGPVPTGPASPSGLGPVPAVPPAPRPPAGGSGTARPAGVTALRVTFARARITVPARRRTVVAVTVRRGRAPLVGARVTLRWLGGKGTFTARTDRRGVASIALSGRRGGVLEARVGRATDRLSVVVRRGGR